MESVYSQRIRAGKRRTYFFDVRETRGNDFYLTITESRKKFNEDGYDRHKIFLYKEDFNKFLKGMTEAIDFVKTDLMPDFDFDAFNHDNDNYEGNTYPPKKDENQSTTTEPTAEVADTTEPAATPDVAAAPEQEEPSMSATPPPAADDADTSHKDEEVDKW